MWIIIFCLRPPILFSVFFLFGSYYIYIFWLCRLYYFSAISLYLFLFIYAAYLYLQLPSFSVRFICLLSVSVYRLLFKVFLFFFLFISLFQSSLFLHTPPLSWPLCVSLSFFCLLYIFTNPSARAGYDTRSIFKRCFTGLNSEFFFS